MTNVRGQKPEVKSTTTRRAFLGRCGWAALTAAAAPMVLRSGVLAANGKPGANDRIVIAVIGTGFLGGSIAGRMRDHEGVTLGALADVNLEKAEPIAEEHEVDVYQDYRRILDRDDIDAVVVATPEHWRAVITVQAAQAGKDIYGEKPFALTIGEGQRMVEAVRKHGRVFQYGAQDRSRPDNHKACVLIRNGGIGKIKRVIADAYGSPYLNGLPGHGEVPDTFDWDLFCGPVHPPPYNPKFKEQWGWSGYREFNGAAMTESGGHGFDQIQWVLGMDDGGPIEVWTEGEPFVPAIDRGEAGGWTGGVQPKVFMRYPGDIIMELDGAPQWGGRIIGEEGEVIIERYNVRSDPPELLEEPLEDPEIEVEHSEHHHRNWFDSIRTREDPISPVEVGHRTGIVSHLGNIARWVSEVTGETGEVLKWDPEKEEFTNSQWGNHFLDRPRRKEYDFPERI